jgi:threonine/homoserine/homoserine lactone efflux protein
LILTFLLTSILIELTPGPNMTWLAVLGATRGRKPALAAVAGIFLGLASAGLVAALGLTVLFQTFPALLMALRYAGTLYLFYLAYDAWSDAGRPEAITQKSNAAYFVQGFVSNALNPKAYLFYAAILPQFLVLPDQPYRELATLTAIYVAAATAIHTMIALLAGSISGWLATSPWAVQVRRLLALAIALAACWFFISTSNLK